MWRLVAQSFSVDALIDLHCHILPGFDDGSPDLATSLAMARIAAADGIETIACTPHIMAGVYDNTATEIRDGIARLKTAINDAGIRLDLVSGADIHIGPDLVTGFRNGQLLSLNDTRYFLLEPPHRILPPRLEDHALSVIVSGFAPILTHPERLSWIDGHYDVVERLGRAGVLMQVTAGSVTGRFGRRPRYWAEGTLWVGQYRDRKIHQVDPQTGAILRTIESNRFVTGVTWIDGELWHGAWEGETERNLRRSRSATEVVRTRSCNTRRSRMPR